MEPAHAIPAAWFADPTDPSQWRWWDGSAWSDHVAPRDVDAPVVSGVVEVEERWELPPVDASLYPSEPDPDVRISYRGIRRTKTLLNIPSIIGAIIGSVVLFAFDAMLSNSRGGVLSGGGGLSNDEFDQMRSQGPSPIVETMRRIRDQSRDVAWEYWFAARGLDDGTHRGHPSQWSTMAQCLPVLFAPYDVNARWMRTSDLAGFPAWWGEMVVTDGEEGRRSLVRTNRRFAAFRIPPGAANRHAGVSVGPRRRIRVLGHRRHGFDETEFESIEVAERLTVDVRVGTDPVSVRELFGPQLVATLADRPVNWDQRFEWLLVHEKSPKDPFDGMDAFLHAATEVARAYWMDQE